MGDLVRLHVTAHLPIRVEPLAYAGRVELRFGNAFPAVLVVDHDALPRLAAAIEEGRAALDGAAGKGRDGAGGA
ncbi:hypothetical protein [Saccharothrix syringae]|uniref:Uncharacterized protein n=1 Tax=Saccharothrix syringae TaxID=103733 RepID=A0A5Q0GSZ9_SACSY|nr:hypothetical protein [Saccharothrix syringae]QFZ16594.1 hypothetical protein EKG83_03125 [Saccharothrix syringae]